MRHPVKATVVHVIIVVIMLAKDMAPLPHRIHPDYGDTPRSTDISRSPTSRMPKNDRNPLPIHFVLPNYGNDSLPLVNRPTVTTTWSTTNSENHRDESARPEYRIHADIAALPSLVGRQLIEMAIYWESLAPTRLTPCRRRGELWHRRHARLRAEHAADARHLQLHHARDMLAGAWTSLTLTNMTTVVQQYASALVSSWWTDTYPLSATVQMMCVTVDTMHQDDTSTSPARRHQQSTTLRMLCLFLFVLFATFGAGLGAGGEEPMHIGADMPGTSTAPPQQPPAGSMPPPPRRVAANARLLNRDTTTAESPPPRRSEASHIEEPEVRNARSSRRSRQSANRGTDRTQATTMQTGSRTPTPSTNRRMYNDRRVIQKLISEITEPPILTFNNMGFLGQGKYSTVYSLSSPLLNARIAIKLQARTTDATDAQYCREVAMTAAASHPFCAHLIYAKLGYSHTAMFLRIAGLPLQVLLRDTEMYKNEEAILVMSRQILLALDHLHRAVGISHKDLHAGNVLVDADAVRRDPLRAICRVADFGISEKILIQGGNTEEERENLRADQNDARADVEALATLAFVAYFGKSPDADWQEDGREWPFYDIDENKYESMSDNFRQFFAELLTTQLENQLTASAALAHPAFHGIIVGIVSDIESHAARLLTLYKQSDRIMDRSTIYDVADQLSTALPTIVTDPRLRVCSATHYPRIHRGRGESVGPDSNLDPVQEIVYDVADEMGRTLLDGLYNWRTAETDREESIANRIVQMIRQGEDRGFTQRQMTQIEGLIIRIRNDHLGAAPTIAPTTTTATTATATTTTATTATTTAATTTAATVRNTTPTVTTTAPAAATVAARTPNRDDRRPPGPSHQNPRRASSSTQPTGGHHRAGTTPTRTNRGERPGSQPMSPHRRVIRPLLRDIRPISQRQQPPNLPIQCDTLPFRVAQPAPMARGLVHHRQMPSTSNPIRFDSVHQHLADQVKRANEQFDERDAELKRTRLDIVELRRELTDVTGRLGDRNRENDRLKAAVLDGNRRIVETENRVTAREGELAQAQAEQQLVRNQRDQAQAALADSQAALAHAQQEAAANDPAAIAADPRRFLDLIRLSPLGVPLVTLPALRQMAMHAGYNFPSRTKAPLVGHIVADLAGAAAGQN